MQISSMQTQQAITGALKGSAQVMSQINEDMDVSAIRDVLKSFNKEMAKADMNQEMMGDAFDMMENPDVQAGAEDVYEGILGEIGLEMTKDNQVINKEIV